MDFCSMAEFLYRAVPLRRFRDWLIRAHMEGCPRCQAGLLSRDEARSLLVGPADVGPADALWRRISRHVESPAPVPRPASGEPGWVWRWAAAAAMTAAIAVAGFWVLRQVERPEAGLLVAEAQRFEIDYINVGGEPARTFVYQPQGTDSVFVWASKTP
jgi:hypothetical protein